MEGQHQQCCFTCGLPADNVCKNCQDTAYCSRDCQMYGWKQADHRLVCKGPAENRTMNRMILELFRAELAFFKSMTVSQKGKLACQNSNFADFQSEERVAMLPLNHFSQAGQIALCLAGVHACAMISDLQWQEFGELYHENVTKEWYARHEDFLKQRGFICELVEGIVQVNDRMCLCGCERDLQLYGSGLLFKNEKSDLIDTVNKVFVEKARHEVTYDDLTRCTSFVRTVDWHEYDEGKGAITAYYMTQPPKVVFGDSSLCSCGSPCFENKAKFSVQQGDAKTLGKHFWKCYSAMLGLGLRLGFFIGDSDEGTFEEVDVDEYNDVDDIYYHVGWTDEAFAECWSAAADNDFRRLFRWLDTKTVIQCEHMDRSHVDRIRSILLARKELSSR